jgi:hypothetical protein
MNDRERVPESGNPFGSGEPARDALVGSRLRELLGTPPENQVDWGALARRIAVATTAPLHTPWWSYAARWERRVLPLALAAGIAAGAALWGAEAPRSTVTVASEELVGAVSVGAPTDDVARSLARSIASDPSSEVQE